jgi:hypothetical protein
MAGNSGSVLTRVRHVRQDEAGRGTAAPSGASGRRSPEAVGPSPTITVLVPAHDEADRILHTLAGLRRQTLPPTRIVVVADNCSDDTVPLALSAGAEVYETVGNRHKKAGALNQAWSRRFRRTALGDRRGPDRRHADRRVSFLPIYGPEERGPARRGSLSRRQRD